MNAKDNNASTTINEKTQNELPTKVASSGVIPKEIHKQQLNRELDPSEQKIFEWEIAQYRSQKNSGPRRYPLDRDFKWDVDMWPHYRQLIERDYRGPEVSLEEHKEQVRQHLLE